LIDSSPRVWRVSNQAELKVSDSVAPNLSKRKKEEVGIEQLTIYKAAAQTKRPALLRAFSLGTAC